MNKKTKTDTNSQKVGIIDVVNNPQILLQKEYLTIEETIELFGIHENTVYSLIRRGELKKPIKHLQRNYIKSSDLIEYIQERFGNESVSKWLGKTLPIH